MDKLDKLKDIIADTFINKHFIINNNKLIFKYHYSNEFPDHWTGMAISEYGLQYGNHYTKIRKELRKHTYTILGNDTDLDPFINKVYSTIVDKLIEKYFPDYLEV
jgi:hypothetical protein